MSKLSAPSATPSSGSTSDRILDAAELLFAERGLAGTAVRDIAAHTGLNPASLYNHFSSKQALYEAVLERGLRPLLDLLADVGSRQAPGDQGNSIITSVMAYLAQRPHLPRLIQHEAVRGGDHLAALARRWIHPLTEQVRTAAKQDPGFTIWNDEEIPLLIVAWMNMIFGHFAMAPLLRELLDEDPLSPAGIEQETELLRKLARCVGESRSPG